MVAAMVYQQRLEVSRNSLPGIVMLFLTLTYAVASGQAQVRTPGQTELVYILEPIAYGENTGFRVGLYFKGEKRSKGTSKRALSLSRAQMFWEPAWRFIEGNWGQRFRRSSGLRPGRFRTIAVNVRAGSMLGHKNENGRQPFLRIRTLTSRSTGHAQS
jgi:hypothetical protein